MIHNVKLFIHIIIMEDEENAKMETDSAVARRLQQDANAEF